MSRSFLLWCTIGLLAFSSCRSDFETVRTSGDLALLYKKSGEYFDKGDYLKAQQLFELVMPSFRGRPELEKLSFNYAYSHYHLQNFISAGFYFKNFSTTFLSSKLREEAEFMSAYCEYKQSPNFRLEQENTQKAIAGFQVFANNYPESPRVKQCNQLIDDLRKKLETKAADEGDLYFQLSQYQAAIRVYENMLKDFPETNAAERIRFRILQSAYLLAENSIFEKQEERFKAAIDKYNDYTQKFPRAKYRREAEIYLKSSNKKLTELKNVRYQIQSSRS